MLPSRSAEFEINCQNISGCTRHQNDEIVSQILAKGSAQKESKGETAPSFAKPLTHLENRDK